LHLKGGKKLSTAVTEVKKEEPGRKYLTRDQASTPGFNLSHAVNNDYRQRLHEGNNNFKKTLN